MNSESANNEIFVTSLTPPARTTIRSGCATNERRKKLDSQRRLGKNFPNTSLIGIPERAQNKFNDTSSMHSVFLAQCTDWNVGVGGTVRYAGARSRPRNIRGEERENANRLYLASTVLLPLSLARARLCLRPSALCEMFSDAGPVISWKSWRTKRENFFLR